MLKLDNVEAGYGYINVLKGISLEVKKGEIVTLIGANGAGKTTTLMTISGILKTKGGEITFEGEKINKMEPYQIVKKGILQVPEGRKIFPKLTVLENLEMGAFTRKEKNYNNELEKVFTLFPILKERMKQYGGTLSGGEQQMLAIGRAIMGNPKLLLLDEPSLGLAPIVVKKIFEVILELNHTGVTILLVEQNAKMALQIAHRGYVMETGKIVMSDDAKALLFNEKVQEAYLGKI